MANEELSTIRDDLDPQAYLGWIQEWVDLGASLLGGCCGIGPEHIALMAETFLSLT
ncbi:MAG: homocysteine S-methyltransferase family protein [Spirochaetales bacterium]|nr:homocysteine S-methyltransferase family protein [Spirochaetales bacterium]